MPQKPFKVHSEERKLRESLIYYRYAGQTRPITFSELTAMFMDRERIRIRDIPAPVAWFLRYLIVTGKTGEKAMRLLRDDFA
jgi:hypothetical protein